MLVELRQYRVRPGQRENWVRYMEEVIVPFQTARGMRILGQWVGEQEDDLFVWIRQFESESERERLYQAVYDSDEWKNTISPRVGELIDRSRINVTRLQPATAVSTAQG
jgi:NIPSNAP